MKLELAAFRELAAFAQFASDLDRTTRAQLERGLRSQEVLKQPQYQPFSLAKEVTIIYALTNGFLDDVPVDKVRAWENEFHRFMETAHPEIVETIARRRRCPMRRSRPLKTAIDEFKQAGRPSKLLCPRCATFGAASGRIRNTAKITKAMELVAASRLRRAQHARHGGAAVRRRDARAGRRARRPGPVERRSAASAAGAARRAQRRRAAGHPRPRARRRAEHQHHPPRHRADPRAGGHRRSHRPGGDRRPQGPGLPRAARPQPARARSPASSIGSATTT